jgi:hypothetical protein
MVTTFEWSLDGFLERAPYSFHLHLVFKDFEGAFPGLERINVHLHERSFTELSHNAPRSPFFSFKDRVGQMRFDTQRYYDPQGSPLSTPEPADVLRELRELLNMAKEQYMNDPSRK